MGTFLLPILLSLFKEGRKVLVNSQEGTYTGRRYIERPELAPPYGGRVKHEVIFAAYSNAYEKDQIIAAPNPYQEGGPYND